MSGPNLFFSTPVWTSKLDNYEETNEKIYTYIKSLQAQDNKGVIKSNVKGRHSQDFNLKERNVVDFINMISPKIICFFCCFELFKSIRKCLTKISIA